MSIWLNIENIWKNTSQTVNSGFFWDMVSSLRADVGWCVKHLIFYSIMYIASFNITALLKCNTYIIKFTVLKCPFQSLPISFFPQSLATSLLSVSMDMLILDIFIYCLLCLASLKVHPCCDMCQCFIPFYGQILYCMDISHLFYPLLSWWTLEFFTSFGYHKYTAMNVYV